MNTIIQTLIDSLPEGAPVNSVHIGLHWTAVFTHRVGLAATLRAGELPQVQSGVRQAGRLHTLSARELVQLSSSESPTERSVGQAAINSLLEVPQERCIEINAAEVIAERGAGKNVVVVGHFPFIPRIKEVAARLSVLELRPEEGDLPASAAREVIPAADVVAITSSSLINRTFDELIALCPPHALVLLLGPSTPLSPILFDFGIDILSGTVVTDPQTCLECVCQGASFRQMRGVRLLTMRK
jgi:uncharacterized protein